MSSAVPSQDDVIRFLSDELSLDGAPPKIIHTHISIIFLSGSRGLKMKRAVQYSFLDFRALGERETACRKEIDINRRTAPSVYKGVVAVTAKDGALSIGGDGEAVEWLVDMERFDEAGLFSHLAGIDKGLRRPLIEDLADVIARFHDNAAVKADRGGYAGIRKIAKNNVRAFEAVSGELLDNGKIASILERTLTMIEDKKGVLDGRRRDGRVRACHGDLHLNNICLIDGAPTLFDAIEFSEDFSDIDVLYDLAFLLMDLEFHGKRRLAAFLLNRYLDVGNDRADAFDVLPIFMSMRAQVRAHVCAAMSRTQKTREDATGLADDAKAYLDLAGTYLEVTEPRLVAVGGLSGSGKSRLARELARFVGNAPGARVVRTDVVRKRLSGIHPNEKLGPDGYTPEKTEATYARFVDEAKETLASGQSVILDAVFAKQDQRERVERIAVAAGVPFNGIWVDAPEDVRAERVGTRKRNVSDITVDIAREQSSYDLGEVAWAPVDSSGAKEATIEQGLNVLGLCEKGKKGAS